MPELLRGDVEKPRGVSHILSSLYHSWPPTTFRSLWLVKTGCTPAVHRRYIENLKKVVPKEKCTVQPLRCEHLEARAKGFALGAVHTSEVLSQYIPNKYGLRNYIRSKNSSLRDVHIRRLAVILGAARKGWNGVQCRICQCGTSWIRGNIIFVTLYINILNDGINTSIWKCLLMYVSLPVRCLHKFICSPYFRLNLYYVIMY